MGPSRSAVVGAFLAGGLLLFAVGLFMIGDRRLLFVDRFVLHTEFSRITGVQVGTKVRVAGLDAGEVLDITIPPGPSQRFRVAMRVREDLHPLVRADSVAALLTDGLLGAVFIQIGRGTDEAPPAEAGGTIAGRDAVEFGDLIEEGRQTFQTVSREMVELKANLAETVDALTDTVATVDGLVTAVGGDVEKVSKASVRFVEEGGQLLTDTRAVVDRVTSGHGTVGRLLTDDELYERALGAAGQAEQAVTNVRETTQALRRAVDDLAGEGGPARELIADTREVLDLARDAMSDLAENTEALKRNWLFRGFFTSRGFYDLDELTREEYRTGFAQQGNRTALRLWLDATGLFEVDSEGREVLSEVGRTRLDSAMGTLLRYPPNSPLVVEGYAAAGSVDAQFLASRSRATQVRDYLVRRFGRAANLTGVMPLGADAAGSPSGDGRWEGVALALFVRTEALAAAGGGTP